MQVQLCKLADDIYKDTIDIIIKDIPEDKKEEISKEYYFRLFRRYSRVKYEEKDYEQVLNKYLESEKRGLDKLTPEQKMNILLYKDALKEIKEIAKKALDMVIDKDMRNKDISVELANQLIEEINFLCEKVPEANKQDAYDYVSEATLDLLYASNQSNVPGHKIR